MLSLALLFRQIFCVWVFLSVQVPAVDNSLSCNRIFPSPGTWTDSPPYWFPNNCNNTQIFGHEETIRCMKGRTLYVIGNSVARQSAFCMVEMLGGRFVKREGQRDLCPKIESTWDDTCHEQLEGVKIKFLHMQYMDGFDYKDRGGFPFFFNKSLTHVYNNPNEALEHSDDKFRFYVAEKCPSATVEPCLQLFFQEAKETDLLIFALGLPYAHVNPFVDMEAWLNASAVPFKKSLLKFFPGTIFHVSNQQTRFYVAYMTPHARRIDSILHELWDLEEQSNPKWYLIDQWAINEGRERLYNDHIHFVGDLTKATVTQALNMVCPGGGKTVERPSNVTLRIRRRR